MYNIAKIKNRREMIRFFDGYSFQRKEEIDTHKIKRPLVKSFLLETRHYEDSAKEIEIASIFERYELILKPIDNDLFLAIKNDECVGFIEKLSSRIIVLYSVLKSQDIETHVRQIISSTPEIDSIWLSGSAFHVLWERIIKLCDHNRFVQMSFTHDSVFDIDEPVEYFGNEEEYPKDTDEHPESEDYLSIKERRAAKFKIVDRIRVVSEKLASLQKTYSPLMAISQLRFPSNTGRGGHDLYDNGKITNRSNNFKDHRNHVVYIQKTYEDMLRLTEEKAWNSPQDKIELTGKSKSLLGVPLIGRFDEPLSQRVFERWIESTFKKKNNKFRLWGNPIKLGATKVHVYGLDRHLWQPLFLEFTNKGCVAILPRGTCGNTVHRLVTNIQRYLDPGAKFFLGDEPYSSIVEKSSLEGRNELSR